MTAVKVGARVRVVRPLVGVERLWCWPLDGHEPFVVDRVDGLVCYGTGDRGLRVHAPVDALEVVQPEPHVLVVTVDPCGDCTAAGPCVNCAEEPDLNYDIECPGMTDACRVWWECRKDHSEADQHAMENAELMHGQEHQLISGLGWSTPGEHCFLAVHADIAEEGSYIAKGKPGRYPVDYDFGDPCEVFLHAIESAEASS